MHPSELSETELLAECRRRHVRRSGPGGQHRNKVETGVVLTHAPSGIEVAATERRSQAANLRQAVARLRLELALRIRSDEPRGEQPSELWRQRCRQGRIRVNLEHPDLPALIAEALDVLEEQQQEVPAASVRLGCSSTQLVKLLKTDLRVFAWFNSQREQRGLRCLK